MTKKQKKQYKYERSALYIDPDIHSELKVEAESRGMKLYKFVNQVLREWLDGRKK